jgi:hypothetical protein
MEVKFRKGEAGCFEAGEELSGFLTELSRISEVLELASAAGAEVRAERCGSVLSLEFCGIE